jgi:hypothetical protein
MSNDQHRSARKQGVEGLPQPRLVLRVQLAGSFRPEVLAPLPTLDLARRCRRKRLAGGSCPAASLLLQAVRAPPRVVRALISPNDAAEPNLWAAVDRDAVNKAEFVA